MKTLPLRVLIVEDEAILAMDIEAMVEDSGNYVVGEAACMREVEALSIHPQPDVAFVDIHLAEGSSGLDVCSHIRARWPEAFIIFLTANPKKIPADFAGGHGVIAKPFSQSGLVSAMRYITAGVIDPPPELPKPASFVASPGIEADWGA